MFYLGSVGHCPLWNTVLVDTRALTEGIESCYFWLGDATDRSQLLTCNLIGILPILGGGLESV